MSTENKEKDLEKQNENKSEQNNDSDDDFLNDFLDDISMSYKDRVLNIIKNLNLDKKHKKIIIKNRFLYEVIEYEKKRENTKKFYNAFRFIVTTGSILLPAILSVGQMDPAKLPRNFENISYWITWTISLMVTASNGFLQLFSLDKNYFTYAIVTEQLKTEGWQFFELAGKYEDFKNHNEGYRTFCKSIESIKRKQVEQEFSGKGAGSKKKPEFNFSKQMEDFQNKFVEEQKQKAIELKEQVKTEMKEQLKIENKQNITGTIQEEEPPISDNTAE